MIPLNNIDEIQFQNKDFTVRQIEIIGKKPKEN